MIEYSDKNRYSLFTLPNEIPNTVVWIGLSKWYYGDCKLIIPMMSFEYKGIS